MTQVTGHEEVNEGLIQPLLSHTPIAYTEMKTLLEPLQWSLQRMESTLLDLTQAASRFEEISIDVSPLWRQETETSQVSSRQQDLPGYRQLDLLDVSPKPQEPSKGTEKSSPEPKELPKSTEKSSITSKLTAKSKRKAKSGRLAADLLTKGQSKTDDSTNGLACSPPDSSALSGVQPQLIEESQPPFTQENGSLAVLPVESSQSNNNDDMPVPVDNSAEEDDNDHELNKHASFCSDFGDEEEHEQEDENQTDEFNDRRNVNKMLMASRFSEGLTIIDVLAVKMERFTNCWNSLEEPERKSCFARFVTSKKFETFVMTVIMLNSILVAYTIDWQVRNIGATSEPPLFDILEKVCLFIFTTELLLRLIAHRLYFFFNNNMHWNIMDFILVSISVFGFVMENLVQVQSGSSNVGFMRVLRLLKLARIFRSMRSFRFFKSLELLLVSFQRSFISLFWGLVMLAFVLYIFSLVFMQAMMDFLSSNDDLDPEKRQQAIRHFGSLGDTLLSLYMAVTGGDDWGRYYDILASAGTVYGLLMVFFTFFFLFALFNILTGSLVEKAIATSKPERTDMILHQRKEIIEEKKQFLDVCKAMDQDGNGKISWKEFQKWMVNPVMLAYMASIGIAIHDVELFFETVGAREGKNTKAANLGEITIEHFVEGCMHMKGTATALDMQRQLFEMHMMHHDLNHFAETFTVRMQQLENLENLIMQFLNQKLGRYDLVSRIKAEQRHGETKRNHLSI